MDSNEMIRRGFQADRVYRFYINFEHRMVFAYDVTWDSEQEIKQAIEGYEKRDRRKYERIAFEKFCYYHDLWGFTANQRRY